MKGDTMTTQRNEAAERLRRWLAVDGRYVDAHPTVDILVDEALATERRLTVERIREGIVAFDSGIPMEVLPALRSIFDDISEEGTP